MRACRRHFLRAALLLLAAGTVHAVDYVFNVSMVTGADADIRLTVPGGQMPQSGFLPVQVRINNRSSSERTWRLELGSSPMSGYMAGNGVSVVNSLNVPAASTREFHLYAPVATGGKRGGFGIRGNLDGPQVQRAEFTLGLSYAWGSRNAAVAVEPSLEARLRDALTEFMKPPVPAPGTLMPTRRGFRGPAPTAAVPVHNLGIIDPAAWPADWRLWSQFSTVVIEHATWERLDATRRRALLDWVALGGRLVRVGSPTVARESHGAGIVLTRRDPMLREFRDVNEFLMTDTNRQGLPSWKLVNPGFWQWSLAEWQLRGRHGWLTGYILVFGLLIGPANLFFFAPAGRRHRLFVTVPLISLAAAALLFAVITVHDGFGGAGTRRGLVVLLPAQNQAAVFQQQVSRTGMLTGRKFPLPADAMIDLDLDDRPDLGTNQQLLREGDEASGDWFASRSMQQHSLRRLVPTRERVELVGPPGSNPVVQSTVSGTLRDFLFIDPDGTMWTAAEVPPGTRVTLVAAPDLVRPGITDMVGKFTPSLALGRGAFYAFGGSGGLIPTLPSIRWRDDVVLYTGRLGYETEGAP